MDSLLKVHDTVRRGMQYFMASRFYGALNSCRVRLAGIASRVESGDPTAIEEAPEAIREAVTAEMGKTPKIQFGTDEPKIIDVFAVIKRTFETYARDVSIGYYELDLEKLPVYECLAEVDAIVMITVQIMSFFLERKTKPGYLDIRVIFEQPAVNNPVSVFFNAEVPHLTAEELDSIGNKVRGDFGLEHNLFVARFFAIYLGGELQVANRENGSVWVDFQLPQSHKLTV